MKNNSIKNRSPQKNSKMKFKDQRKFKINLSNKNFPYYSEINSKIITTTCDGDSSYSVNQKNATSSNTSSKTGSNLKKKSLIDSSKKRGEEEDDYKKTTYNTNISFYGFESFLNKKVIFKNIILDINKYNTHKINYSFDQRYKQIKKYGFFTKILKKPDNFKNNVKNKKYAQSKFSRNKNLKSDLIHKIYSEKNNNENHEIIKILNNTEDSVGENIIIDGGVTYIRSAVLEEKNSEDKKEQKKILGTRQLKNNESNNVSNNDNINTLPVPKGKFNKKKSPTKLVKKNKNRIFSLDLNNNNLIYNTYISNNSSSIAQEDSLNTLFNTTNNTKKNLDSKFKNINQTNTKSNNNLFSSPNKMTKINFDSCNFKNSNNLNKSKNKIFNSKFSPCKSYNNVHKPIFIKKNIKQNNRNKNKSDISNNFALIDTPQKKICLNDSKNIFPDHISINFEDDNKINNNIIYLKNKISKRNRSPNSILTNNKFKIEKKLNFQHIKNINKNSHKNKDLSKNNNSNYLIQKKFNNNVSKIISINMGKNE